jgi:ribosomal protein S18 acetylase RimI-like enzyme
MTIRPARLEDAPALGAVMVSSWLSAHRGQMPEDAWRERQEEWTPDVSATGWARVLSEQADRDDPDDVLLVAEAEGSIVGLVYACAADESSRVVADIKALYVAQVRRGGGYGRALLHAAAEELTSRGYAVARLEVLSANLPARGFYEHLGGHEVGQGWFDEDGQLQPVTYYEWTCEELHARTLGFTRPTPGTKRQRLSGPDHRRQPPEP